MRALALAAIVSVLAVAGASAAAPDGWRTFARNGVSVRYPPTWHATAARLTPVTAPSQVLAIASYQLPRDSRGANGCSPMEALDRLPPAGAFVFGWDYGDLRLPGLRPHDFPRRPARFRMTRPVQYECLGRSSMIRFRDHGRFLQIHVAFGSRATASTRRTVLRVLDSLRVRSR
jgi:hypothetical protein